VLDCPHAGRDIAAPDPDIVFSYDEVIEGRKKLQP